MTLVRWQPITPRRITLSELIGKALAYAGGFMLAGMALSFILFVMEWAHIRWGV